MKFGIREAEFSEVKHLRAAANRDRVGIKERENTRWFAAHCDEAIVGAAAFTMLRFGRARIRSVWVMPEWRGLGIGDAFTSRIIEECRGKAAVIDAYAYNPGYYVRRGWHISGKKTCAEATPVAMVLATRAQTVKRKT